MALSKAQEQLPLRTRATICWDLLGLHVKDGHRLEILFRLTFCSGVLQPLSGIITVESGCRRQFGQQLLCIITPCTKTATNRKACKLSDRPTRDAFFCVHMPADTAALSQVPEDTVPAAIKTWPG